MKRIISLFLAIIICLSFSATVFAESPFDQDLPGDGSEYSGRVDPMRPEETVWYFRTFNGMKQMRLWSLTYGRWLTPWIDIGPVDP